MTATKERTNWAGRVNDINPEFVDFMASSMRSAAMQVEIIDILIDILKKHDLFSTVLHKEGTNSYRIALKYETKYRLTNIVKIRVNFNRFNMSLILCDNSEDLKFGTFRFRTVVNKPVKCTLTSMVHYTSSADIGLIDELKKVFYETESRYDSGEKRYKELEEEVDYDTTTIYDLCQMYTSDCILAGKLARCGYKDMSVNEFVSSVNLKELKKKPGIGTKTISLLKEMYIYCGFGSYLRKD